MKNGILLKASILLGVFLVVIGISLAFTLSDKEPTVPSLSNKDDVYVSVGDLEITNQELWNVMKDAEGINYLLDYIDEQILADYLSNITQDEIDEEVLMQKYGTSDLDDIAEIQENDDIHQQYLDEFNQVLTVNGYDPEDPTDLREYVELTVAKKNMAKDFILESKPDAEFGVTEVEIRQFFEEDNYGDVCGINVRFASSQEATLVMDHFDLVPDFNLGIGRYVGDEPIEDVASDDFDNENTEELTDEEIFQEYIKLYNYMNPWEEQITEGISMNDFCMNYSDRFVYNFEDMTDGLRSTNPNVKLANYLFNTLDLDEEDEDAIRYAYSTQVFGDYVMLSYKVSEEDSVEWDSLTDEEIEALKEELVDERLVSSTITSIMQEKRSEFDFEIYDPEIAMKYEQEFSTAFENDGSDTLIATFDGSDITADMLFDYMAEKVGAYYSLEAIKVNRIVQSDAYVDNYGESRDYMDNNSDLMKEHRSELRTMKSMFSSNQYAQYGFASADYTWQEFMYLAFSADDENDILEQVFVLRTLQPKFVDPDYTLALDYIEEVYNQYFSVQAKHLLLYVDFDKDFTPDKFNDLLDTFSSAEMTEYNALKVGFENLVFEKLDDDYTFEEIIDEFEDSLIDDPENEWAAYKQYGFNMMTETLTVQEQQSQQNQQNPNLTHKNTTNFDDDFVAALKRIYDKYSLDQNKGEASFLDSQLTVTNFGIHLIEASKGDKFEQPTATFEFTDENQGDYSDGSENDGDIPTIEQIRLYHEIKYASLDGSDTDALLPDSVYDACEEYVGPIFNGYFNQTGYSISTIAFALDNNITYTTNNADLVAHLEDTLEILYDMNFPEEFNNPINNEN